MTGHDSILAAINDASEAIDQFEDTVTEISVEVPITALRWLVHAASMHYTHTYANQTGDDTLYRVASTMNDRFRDQMIDHGTLIEITMQECFDCGVRSPDQEHFQRINREKAGYNYPGSDGDLACAACAVGHAEWFKEH